MKLWAIIYGLVWVTCICFCQAPPSSDIYMVQFQPAKTSLRLETLVNVTQRSGYDNQPHFLPDGTLLYTSIRDDNQADIYHYNPKTKQTRQVTRTAESEYSPTLMPDGQHISVIRVEANNDQRLWQFDLKGENAKVLLETVKGIGYHAWLDSKKLGVFIVGQPHTLQWVTTGEEKPSVALSNIGRCLSIVPQTGALSIVHKRSPQEWMLVAMDGSSGEKKDLRLMLEGSEDFAWTPEGTLISGQGTTIYRSTPLAESVWQPVADLNHLGIQAINRLAVSKDGQWLAFVAAN